MKIFVVSDDGFEVGEFRSFNGDVVEYVNPDTGTLHSQDVEDVYFDRSEADEEYASNFDHISNSNGA